MTIIRETIQPGIQTWVWAYGTHLVSGARLFTEGDFKVAVALGEGEWDAVEKVWFQGDELDPSRYTFHPGALSSGDSDPVQGSDPIFTGGTHTFSRSAWIAFNLDTGGPELTDDVREIVGRYRCRKVVDYSWDDETETLTVGSLIWSNNPALCAADAIVAARGLPTSRVFWSKWQAWKEWCAEEITVIEEGSTVETPRAECNVFFTQGATLAQMLDAICFTGFASWVDDGDLFHFFFPGDGRTPEMTIGPSQRKLQQDDRRLFPPDLRETPNLIWGTARDSSDERMREWKTFSDWPDDIDQNGVLPSPDLNLPPMRKNQLQRTLDWMLRLRHLADETYVCAAGIECLPLIPGGLVTVDDLKHLLAGAAFEVTEVRQLPPNRTIFERVLTCRKWVEGVYSDVPNYKSSAATLPRPTDFSGTVDSNTSVSLTWTLAGSPSGIEVWRNGGLLTTLAGSATNYTDSARTACTRADYRIRSVFTVGGYTAHSSFTPIVRAETTGCAVGQTPTNQE